MSRIISIVRKELLQLLRDKQALALLFLMPALFILIMSLALQSGFEERKDVQIDYFFVDQAESPASRELMRQLDEPGNFHRITGTSDLSDQRALVSQDKASFLLLVLPGFDALLANGETAVRLEIAPGTKPPAALLFESHVRRLMSGLYIDSVLRPLLEMSGGGSDDDNALVSDTSTLAALVEVESLFEGRDGRQIPSSVQQNVPAWLVFAMFFVSLPISTTLIAERFNGTLARLETMSLPRSHLFIGKLIPYLLINLCQAVVMLLVGVFAVPVLGGEQLLLGSSYAGIAAVVLCTSMAAVSFGLMIAQMVRTTEQATVFAGAINIVLAAISGIMVPRFLMPQTMQDLSWISPMTWGLEGFLDLFLRAGTFADVLYECAGLLAFSGIMLLIGVLLQARAPQY